jgi:hypothetical protein
VFDWLFEGRTAVYVVLAAAAAFLLVLWWRSRKRWCLTALGVVVALWCLYALLNYAVETDREQIIRKINEMAARVNAHDLDGAFEHISDDFRGPGGTTKEDLRKRANDHIKSGIVTSVDVWDVECPGAVSRERQPAEASFMVKVHGVQGVEGFFARCESTFAFDPGHGWQMKGFRLFKPQTTEEWVIPGLGR